MGHCPSNSTLVTLPLQTHPDGPGETEQKSRRDLLRRTWFTKLKGLPIVAQFVIGESDHADINKAIDEEGLANNNDIMRLSFRVRNCVHMKPFL